MKARTRIGALAMAAGLAVSATANAQYGFVTNVSGTFVDISTTGTLVGRGDDTNFTITTTVGNAVFPAGTTAVCTNGFITAGLASGGTSLGNVAVPPTGVPAGLTTGGMGYMIPWWDDLQNTTDATSNIYWQEINGVLIIQWNKYGRFSAVLGQDTTFEVQVFGTPQNNVFLQYIYPDSVYGGSQAAAYDHGLSATVGYANGNNASANNAQFSFNTASITDGLVVTYTTVASGACCLGDGTCSVFVQGQCVAAGGTYRGDNTTCATANCPSGACCLGNGTCVTTASAGCTAQNGTYRGDGTTCATANCPSGACCLANGTCVTTASAGCTAQSGAYQGDGTVCGTITCPQPGACCNSDGTCSILLGAACTAGGGVYRGDGSACASANCPGLFIESGDAGDLPATSQNVTGSGNLIAIQGSLTSGDADMFKLTICDAANFQANTANTATTVSDTQLFLFDSTGHGITSDDDDPTGTGGLHSRITAQFIPSTGDYYLAISGYNHNPLGADTAGLIWLDTPFNVERRPDGPAMGEVVGSWDTAATGTGTYVISLTGACYLGSTSHCYANCDGSTGTGFLNINDFVCFQSAFAAGASYANCDGSTGAGNLNINDFVCFQSAFAAGCSAP